MEARWATVEPVVPSCSRALLGRFSFRHASEIADKSVPTCWEVPNYFDVDAQGITLVSFSGPVVTLGLGSFCLTYYDHSDAPLSGENNHSLHVPANVPASQFWALTVYDLETEAFFLNSTHITADSLDKAVRKNADESVAHNVGPKPPAGKEANWIYYSASTRMSPRGA